MVTMGSHLPNVWAIHLAWACSRNAGEQPPKQTLCLAEHGCLHERYWAHYAVSRWRRATRPCAVNWPWTLTAALGGCLLYRALAPDFAPGPAEIPSPVRDEAALVFALCWIPALSYLAKRSDRRRPIPFYPLYGVLYSLYYALTPMLGLSNFLGLGGHRTSFNAALDYARPLDLILSGWIALTAGYVVCGRLRITRAARPGAQLERLSPVIVRKWALALLGLGLVSEIMLRLGWVSHEFVGVGFLLGFVMEAAIIVVIVLNRNSKLPPLSAATALAGVTAAVFLRLGSSATGQVLFVVFALFVGTWLERRKIPPRHLVVAGIAVAACVAVRGVMGPWRNEVWETRKGDMSQADRSLLMVGLLRQKLDAKGAVGAVADGWQVIAHRSANADLLTDAVLRTPDEVPFWDGSTYRSLAGALVPRFIWPDKPEKTLGQDYGHRYGYLSDSDLDTSFNLPVLVEFYINYGTVGVILGMFVLGTVLRGIEDVINVPGQGLLISAAATPILVRLLVMECDFSLVFGGLPLQLPSLWFISLAMLLTAGVIPGRPKVRPPWYAPVFARLGET